jgi:uncharacterized protein (TIGR03503 family)
LFAAQAQADIRQIQNASPAVDVRVVVDISGSMKKSDPKNLRRPAVQLAAEMIPEGSAAGVWTFGRFVNMLVPLGLVDNQWRARGKEVSSQINSIGLYTNIPEALEKASYGWSSPPGDTARSLILLTDGKIDISKDAAENARARQDVLSRLVPMLRSAQAKVHTIAMSEDVDVELLRALSFETDGRFQTVNSRDDLVRVFLEAFDASVPSQQVPLDPGNRFNIDGGVKEFTLLVHKAKNAAPVSVRSPSGVQFDEKTKPRGVRWFSDPRLEVITVKAPEAGAWQLLADVDPDNRVTVISDLNLSLSGLPSNILQGETLVLNINFTGKEGVITNPDFLKLIDLNFKQNYLDGNQTWQGALSSYSEGKVNTPADGIYQPQLHKALLPGQHEITISAEGRTFKRKVSQKITVIDQAVKVFFDPPTGADKPFTVRVEPVVGLVDESLRVRAKVQAPDKVVKDIEMGPDPEAASVDPFADSDATGARHAWSGAFKPYSGAGVYRVIVQAVGQTTTGREFSQKLGPFEAEMPQALLRGADSSDSSDLSDDEIVFAEVDGETIPPAYGRATSQIAGNESGEGLDLDDEGQRGGQLEDDGLDALTDESDVLGENDYLDDAGLDQEVVPEAPSSEEDQSSDLSDSSSDERSEESTERSPLLKYGLWGTIALVNLFLITFGLVTYREVMKKRAEEEAMEDARLAVVTQADESDFKKPEPASDASDASDDTSSSFLDGIPDGMPDMDDDDDDFDLSKTGNQ